MSNPSDVDLSWSSPHHTLGRGPTQAAPGNHKHKLSDIEGGEGGTPPSDFESVDVQCGISIPTDATGSVTVTFGTPFNSSVYVVGTVVAANGIVQLIEYPTPTYAKFKVLTGAGAPVVGAHVVFLAAGYVD